MPTIAADPGHFTPNVNTVKKGYELVEQFYILHPLPGRLAQARGSRDHVGLPGDLAMPDLCVFAYCAEQMVLNFRNLCGGKK